MDRTLRVIILLPNQSHSHKMVCSTKVLALYHTNGLMLWWLFISGRRSEGAVQCGSFSGERTALTAKAPAHSQEAWLARRGPFIPRDQWIGQRFSLGAGSPSPDPKLQDQ